MNHKITLLACLFLSLAFTSTRAQNLELPKGIDCKLVNYDKYVKQNQARLSKTNATETDWFDPAVGLTNNGNPVTESYYVLFPDSTVKFAGKNAGGTFEYGHTFVHQLGGLLDPRADIYAGSPFNLDRISSKYTVDSIRFAIAYERFNPDPNIVDTMVVTVFEDLGGVIIKGYFINPDSFCTTWVNYNYTTNSAIGSYTMKFPLTVQDTTGGFRNRTYPLNTIYNGGRPSTVNLNLMTYKIFGFSYAFKPGYAYSFGDTISDDVPGTSVTKKLNQVTALINRENSRYDQSSFKDKPAFARIFNNGLLGFKEVRYNISTNFNGYLVPGNAYTSYLYPDYNVHVTGTNVGIAAKSNDIKNINVYPNPTNGTDAVTIEYKLAKSSNISIELLNILGKKVYSNNLGKVNAGPQSQSINVQNLPNGIYFVNINVDGAVQIVKFTVTK